MQNVLVKISESFFRHSLTEISVDMIQESEGEQHLVITQQSDGWFGIEIQNKYGGWLECKSEETFEKATKVANEMMWNNWKCKFTIDEEYCSNGDKSLVVLTDENSCRHKSFLSYEEAVEHIKAIYKNIFILDYTVNGSISVTNGDITLDSEYGLGDEYLIEKWFDHKEEKYENIRYSKYDVYGTSELL